jgi:hypothetical protein
MAEEDDDAEDTKFAENETIMAFEVTHNTNRWYQATVKAVKEDDIYDIEFNDPEWYQEESDVPASRMRKLPKGMAPEKFKGMGVWAFDSMSESDAEDWRSEDDIEESPVDAAGSKNKRSRQKQKLNFQQFWELLKIGKAMGGNKSLSISLLRKIAGLNDGDVSERKVPTLRASELCHRTWQVYQKPESFTNDELRRANPAVKQFTSS